MILEKIIKNNTPSSFQFQKDSNGYCRYFKDDENLQLVVGLGSFLLGEFKGIRASIYFNQIEKILDNNCKIGETNPTIDINVNKHLFNSSVGKGIIDQLPISLANEEGIDKACELIKQYITQNAIPFFNYWQDIRDFLPFLETTQIPLHNLFTGDPLLKKIIIWRLCSHPKYDILIEEKSNLLLKASLAKTKDKMFQKNYKKYLNLIKILENTKPLYEWDDTYLIKKEWPSGY